MCPGKRVKRKVKRCRGTDAEDAERETRCVRVDDAASKKNRERKKTNGAEWGWKTGPRRKKERPRKKGEKKRKAVISLTGKEVTLRGGRKWMFRWGRKRQQRKGGASHKTRNKRRETGKKVEKHLKTATPTKR